MSYYTNYDNYYPQQDNRSDYYQQQEYYPRGGQYRQQQEIPYRPQEEFPYRQQQQFTYQHQESYNAPPQFPYQPQYESRYQPQSIDYYDDQYIPLPSYSIRQESYHKSIPVIRDFGMSYMGSQFDDGMITDLEYLSFPNDVNYKKVKLQSRITSQVHREQGSTRTDVTSIFFLSLIENLKIEKQLEELRQRLCMQQDFSIPTIFNVIDSNGSGNLTCAEFSNGLAKIGLNSTVESMKLIYVRFAKQDSREMMSLNHFGRLFLPLGHIKSSVMNRNVNQLPEQFTIRIMGDLLNLYRKQELQFEQIRKKLDSHKIDYMQIFQTMDKNGTRSLGLSEFQTSLNSYSSHKLSNQDALLLFSRFDKSGDGTITYLEFKSEMQCKLL